MPTDYELMEAYRSWWRDNFSMSPNSQAVIHAAAWARHALEIYQSGALDAPTAEPPEPTAPAQPVGEAS